MYPSSSRVLGREHASHPGGAVDDDLGVLVGEHVFDLDLEVGPGQGPGSRDDPVLGLVGLPDVEELRALAGLQTRVDVLGDDLGDLLPQLFEEVTEVSHIYTLQYLQSGPEAELSAAPACPAYDSGGESFLHLSDGRVHEQATAHLERRNHPVAARGSDYPLVVAGFLIDVYDSMGDPGLLHLALQTAAVTTPGGGVHRHGLCRLFVHIHRFVKDSGLPLEDSPGQGSETQMKAVVYDGSGDVRVDDVPEPKIEDGSDAVVKVTLAAICGSDLHLLTGKTPGMPEGGVIGHEFVGEITDLGDSVSRFSAGDRVIGSFLIACGDCGACSAGRFNFCGHRRALGFGPLTGDLAGVAGRIRARSSKRT